MADYDRGEMNIADYVALIRAAGRNTEIGRRRAGGPLRARGDPAPGLSPGVGTHSSSAGRGEQMLIISASVSLLVQAVAAALEIEQALGIDVAMVDGGYSGAIAGIPSYQQGKVARLAQWREAHPQYDGEVTLHRFH